MINPTSKPKDTTSGIDHERVARRVNGSVAADLQAIEIRERRRREAMTPDPQAIFRRIEAIEAAVYALHVQLEGGAA